MSEEEKKKKTNKGKAAFMFAFAVTVLGSRAGALTASAASVPGGNDANNDDNGNDSSEQEEMGADNGFIKQDSNVYLASSEAASVADFNNSMNGLRGFAVYAKALNASHTEGNICVDNVNVADVYNTNVAQKLGENAPKNYTLYLAEPPKDSNWISVGMQSGTSYELVLGFNFEEFTYDNGNKVGFTANGQDYYIQVNGDINNFSMRSANQNDEFTNISSKLSSIAAAGQALIDQAKAAGFTAEDSLNGLFHISDDFTNDAKHFYKDGQTLVVNVDSKYLNTNESNIYLQNIVTQNKGVNVIVNVITDGDTKSVNLGMTNGAEWNLQAANVTFNFGDYDGEICSSSMMGGIIVAPMADYKLGGNLNGSVYANTVDQTYFEIHQITEDDRVTPPADTTVDTPATTPEEPSDSTPAEEQEEKKEEEKKEDSDVVVDDNEDDDDDQSDDEIGGDGGDDDDDTDDDDTDDNDVEDTTSDDSSDETDDEDSTDKVEPVPPVPVEPEDDGDNSDTPDETITTDDNGGTNDVVDDTPEEPQDETPDEPQDETPDEPQDETPDEPQDETPDEPQDETPDEPQDETPDEPQDETPDEPQDETPDEPQDETPDEPQDETPDEPQDETPDNSITVENDGGTDDDDDTPDDDITEDDTPEDEVHEDVTPEVEEEPEDNTEDFNDTDEVDENEEDVSEVDEVVEEPVEETPSEEIVVTDEVTDTETTETVEPTEPVAPSEPTEDKPVNNTVVDFDNIELDDFDDNSNDTTTPSNDTVTDNHVDDFVMIDDEEVPLADNPYTGVEDTSAGLGIGAAVALGATVAAAIKRKDKKS